MRAQGNIAGQIEALPPSGTSGLRTADACPGAERHLRYASKSLRSGKQNSGLRSPEP